MENLGIFYDPLVYFTATGNILWSFGIFFQLGNLYEEKSGNPGPGHWSRILKITPSKI
jgi:hypothetical protein